MYSLAFVLAIILVIIGIVQILQGQFVLGIVFLVLAALIGPGGYSFLR